MKTLAGTRRLWAAACVMLVVLLCASPGHAGRGTGGGQGGRGGGHGSGHKGGKFHHRGGGTVFVGVGPWWGGPPFWYAPPPPYWFGQPIISEDWVEFIQQQEPPAYWYYCQDPPGYYPSVEQCLGEWLKVLPEPTR
jgi:hypothetical protein